MALVLAFAATFVMSMLSTASAATSTQVVSGNTVDVSAGENGSEGWWFGRDTDNVAEFEFINGVSSIGAGSLEIKPLGSTPANKFIAENFIWQDIADVQSISYDYQIGGNGTSADANEFYMNVYMNFGESALDKYYDCKYDVVPTTGTRAGFTTVTFDPTQSYQVTTRSSSPYTCPPVPADMDADEDNSFIRMFSINVGDTAETDEGLGGYLDNVVLATTGNTTVYDFEAANPDTKDDCKQANHHYGFKNQGLCIQFVNTGKDARNR